MLSWLRQAHWLTARRAAVLGAVAGLLPGVYLVVALAGVIAPEGPAAARDFLSFYAASSLALAGEAASVWIPSRHAAAQAAIVPAGYFTFFYPPSFLLICLPLAMLPYAAAFLVWLGVTCGACIAALARYRAMAWPGVAALCLLAPPAVQNAANGQNAFLTTTLFAAAGLWLDRRPGLAGVALATLSFKPQLGLLVLPALVAARRWCALFAAAAAGLGWIVVSGAVFGPDTWLAFLRLLPRAGEALESGVPIGQIQSLYAMLRSLGVAHPLSLGAQIILTLGALILVACSVVRRPGGRAEIALVASGAPLVTPYVLAYDLTVLLLPVIWIIAEGRRSGFLPWEKLGLGVVLLMPAISVAAGIGYGVSLGPFAPLAGLGLVLRRIGRGAGA